MPESQFAAQMLLQEARAMQTRLLRVKSFALQETMVPAASVSLPAQAAIERFLSQRKRELETRINDYIAWLKSPQGQAVPPEEAQRRFTLLRLRFNTILSQFDIFADVMTQRSEYETGVWLAGLDAFAADALNLPGKLFDPPPVMCYLDRGHGAAIRRARTRLPGGEENPVAVIRVPRERMVGSGLASSLVHETGHQGAALLDLIESIRPELQAHQRQGGLDGLIWRLWERWISEILADLWAVARVGVAGTTGLLAVVSLPRAFVFRVSLDDPHPIPWIRVKLSAAMGNALYPHPQWEQLARVWEQFYPLDDLPRPRHLLLETLVRAIPTFVEMLVSHCPALLHGRSLGEVLVDFDRRPERLREYFAAWRKKQFRLEDAPPSLVFAVIGQARVDEAISPEGESRLVADLLTEWALRRNLLAYDQNAGKARPMEMTPALAPEIFGQSALIGG